jgi:ubiquinone/menaquinone biosynthesis C-methylase UbiE
VDWERTADSFEKLHHRSLARYGAMGWGIYHLPERRLRLLGDVSGKDVLELGCGAALWSIALAKAKARVVGLDLSPRRLEQARSNQRKARTFFPLLEASAESVPLPDSSFDLIFCDYGAMTFADPYRTVPECARLLRPGGELVFATWSPLQALCHDRKRERLSPRLLRPYFGLHRLESEGSVEFQLPYGEWIRLFRENGFEVERLEEPRPPSSARSSFLAPGEELWTRSWPADAIWSVRKGRPSPPRRARPRRKVGRQDARSSAGGGRGGPPSLIPGSASAE